jgi:hypothetical protein
MICVNLAWQKWLETPEFPLHFCINLSARESFKEIPTLIKRDSWDPKSELASWTLQTDHSMEIKYP